MTLDELLDCNASVLEAMSDEELIAYCAPYFNVTRPELAPKPTNGIRQIQPVMSFKEKQDAAKLAELGIDVSHLFAVKRKKR